MIKRRFIPLLLTLALGACTNSLIDPAQAQMSPAATPQNSAPAAKSAATPTAGATKPDTYWGTFDAKTDPKELGKKVVDDLIARDFAANYGSRGGMSYPEICDAYGCVRFAGGMADKDRVAKLTKRYEVFFTPQGKPYITQPNSVDNAVFGILPMEIYRQIKAPVADDKKWLTIGLDHADGEWAAPQASGLSGLTRFWIDDMFMITALQAEAFRVSEKPVYLDRAAKEMVAYLQRLQQPNGLFFHGDGSPFYWGRGNGWMAAGMAELLSVLPEDHPQRKAILEGYKKMMTGLLEFQAKDGMWNQLIDKQTVWPPGAPTGAETSGSGMFVFSMAVGVRNGWLDEKTFKEPVKKAWLTLATHLNDRGQVDKICVGTNKGTTENYYETRGASVGDFHGQAAFIWAAWAMARTPEPVTNPAATKP